MKEHSVAKRYASGLVKSIESSHEYQTIKTELIEFLRILNSIDTFKAGMETALFSINQKTDVLTSVNSRIKLLPKTYQFLMTVIEENRLIFLESMIHLMEELWLEKNGIEKLKVFSVVPLTPVLESRLVHNLEKAFKKKIMIEKEIDPTLIAGIKIQRGLVFYDFSIEGNLKKLKEVLLADYPGTSAQGEH